jgi:hypothetical protein
MQRTISMMELRNAPGSIFDHINLRDDSYIVERKKKPIAVIHSIEANNEYTALVQEKLAMLQEMITNDTTLTGEEKRFLERHAPDMADELKWQAGFENSQDVLAQLAEEAEEAIKSGKEQPLEELFK